MSVLFPPRWVSLIWEFKKSSCQNNYINSQLMHQKIFLLQEYIVKLVGTANFFTLLNNGTLWWNSINGNFLPISSHRLHLLLCFIVLRLSDNIKSQIIWWRCCASTDLWYHHVVFQPDLAKQCHVLSEVVFRDSVYSAEGQKPCRWWSTWRWMRE